MAPARNDLRCLMQASMRRGKSQGESTTRSASASGGFAGAPATLACRHGLDRRPRRHHLGRGDTSAHSEAHRLGGREPHPADAHSSGAKKTFLEKSDGPTSIRLARWKCCSSPCFLRRSMAVVSSDSVASTRSDVRARVAARALGRSGDIERLRETRDVRNRAGRETWKAVGARRSKHAAPKSHRARHEQLRIVESRSLGKQHPRRRGSLSALDR